MSAGLRELLCAAAQPVKVRMMRNERAFAATIPLVAAIGLLAGRPTVTVKIPTETVTVGKHLVITGRASGGRASLEIEREHWQSVAKAPIVHGRFSLAWTPSQARNLRLRVTARRNGRVVARSPVEVLSVASQPVSCVAPTPVTLPAGDGAIVGGVIAAGGPAPGFSACSSQEHMVTLEANGVTVATQAVSERRSYVFLVPPGAYKLYVGRVGLCSGEASVTAGKVTHADTVCPVP